MAKNIIQKAYKFHISKPSKIVQERLEHILNLCSDLYNAALQERRDAYKLNRISITRFDQDKQLPFIKQTNPEYKDIHSQVLQDVLKRLDKIFKTFYSRTKQGKAGFPRFKGQNQYDSFCYPQSGFGLSGNKLTLSKIGTVKLKLSRPIQGKVKTLTIKREIGKWFVVFTVETSIEPLPKTGKFIGIDVGIESFATLSNGTHIDNWKYYESAQKELRRAQRSVSRKKKGSNNRKKAVLRFRKIHQKIKNRRADFQHKASTMIVRNFDVICIEKLNILGMSKGILSKQIHDASWSRFFQKLKYKVENTGKQLVEIPAAFTSQMCICGHRQKKTLSQRQHICSECVYSNHRDIVSAEIILSLGMRELALNLPLGEFAKESHTL